MKIWAHTVVCNEDKFVWFAVMSVIDFVDKILIWDTGSTDKTVEIIKEIQKIKGSKVSFEEVGPVDKYQFTTVRQKMLEESKCDWILILDGDEIWWEDSIKKVIKEINTKGNEIEGIVVPMIVPVGDIYHLQDQSAGRYEILGRKGHYNLRAISQKIPSLHVDWPYGRESYFDINNTLVQEREKTIFINAPYLHVTHLQRSSEENKRDKFKYELGKPFPKAFRYPEVFYETYPKSILSPWVKISRGKLIKAYLLTPLRKIKRRVLS